MPERRTEYVLMLRPLPSGRDRYGRPPVVRLRKFLRLILRGLGFECVRIIEREAKKP
jgi:hypothetical protein